MEEHSAKLWYGERARKGFSAKDKWIALLVERAFPKLRIGVCLIEHAMCGKKLYQLSTPLFITFDLSAHGAFFPTLLIFWNLGVRLDHCEEDAGIGIHQPERYTLSIAFHYCSTNRCWP